MNRKKLWSLLLVSSVLTGCSLIPDYIRPEFSAAKRWDTLPSYESLVGKESASNLEWNAYFDSPEIRSVIDTALQNNKDLKTAALNIEEARAQYRIERADLMPNVNANGSGSLSQTPRRASSTNAEYQTEVYSANLGLSSYELDLFGKIRSTNEAALNSYLATQEAHAIVRNALIAETANAYLQLLADQKLLDLTHKTLDAQQHTYDILSESLKNGVSTEQDLARAATAVESARVNLYQYSRYVAQDQNALFLLMGVAHDMSLLPDTTLDKIKIRDDLDPGIPSEVLLLRPDVRKAEYDLLAKNADIGAARAAFFPSISLTGSYGFASQNLSHLFASGTIGAWSFVPQITLPIFHGGRNKANLDIAKIRKEKAIVAYESVIQTAFREVSDELAARATLDEQLKTQRRLVAAAQKVYDLSKTRYDAGIDSFLSVLDSQRELYAYQQNEIQTERQRLSNLVNLYKALGGGLIRE